MLSRADDQVTYNKKLSNFIPISPFPRLNSLLNLQCFLSVIMNICDSGEAKINPVKKILCSYAKQVLFTGLGFLLKGVQNLFLPWLYVLLYILLKVMYTIPKGCHIVKMIFHSYSPGMKSSYAAFKS